MLTGRTVTNATKRLRTATAAISISQQRTPTAFLPYEDFRSSFGTKRKFPKTLRKREDFSRTLMKYKQKQQTVHTRPLARPLRQNKRAFKDLVFKWLLEAYPESLSRQDIAARIGTRPATVKSAMIKPLLEEGKIFKWGQKAMPYERYMPNVKAPEYYEVTGESPPVDPDVDEKEYLTKIKQSLLTSPREPRDRAAEGEEEVELSENELRFAVDDDDSKVSDEEIANATWTHLFVASGGSEDNDDDSDSPEIVFDVDKDAEGDGNWSDTEFETLSQGEAIENKSRYPNGEDKVMKGRASKQRNGENAAKTGRQTKQAYRGFAAKKGSPTTHRNRGAGDRKKPPPMQGNQGGAAKTGGPSEQKDQGDATKTGGPPSEQKDQGVTAQTGGPSAEQENR